MASPENSNENEEIEEFDFEAWTQKLKLSRKVTQILRTEELTTMEALKLLEPSDLRQIGLPLGSARIIMADIKSSSVQQEQPSDTNTTQDPENEEILQNAGKTIDMLLSDGKTGTTVLSNAMNPHMDPRTILTMKATSRKATHITMFITEKCKRRRQKRRSEYILRAGQSTDTLALKTEEEHPYLGIYIEEWGAANMRLMNFLMQSGELKRTDIEYYLAYTTRIFEFAETYEWNSVLNFDSAYRELQAEHGFQWGTFSHHMEMNILTPKRTKQRVEPVPQQAEQATEDCRIFKARGHCPFGANCRFKHPKHQSKKTTSAAGSPGSQLEA